MDMNEKTGDFTIKVPYKETKPGVWEPRLDGVTKCETCGKDLPDSNCVTVEAPEDFYEKHIDDNTPLIKAWHRECFEKKYGIKLPEFKD
jgi:hypothetical protein